MTPTPPTLSTHAAFVQSQHELPSYAAGQAAAGAAVGPPAPEADDEIDSQDRAAAIAAAQEAGIPV